MNKARRYKPDSICGTWELFGEIIHDGGGNKKAWAEAMAPHLTTQAERSLSPSFKSLLAGMRELAPLPASSPKKRRYRHPTKDRSEPGRRR